MTQTVDVFETFNVEKYTNRTKEVYHESFEYFTERVTETTSCEEFVENSLSEMRKVVDLLTSQGKQVFFVKGLVALHNNKMVVMKHSKYNDLSEVDFGNNDVVYVGTVYKYDNPNLFVLSHT